jgi:hypothetical protein
VALLVPFTETVALGTPSLLEEDTTVPLIVTVWLKTAVTENTIDTAKSKYSIFLIKHVVLVFKNLIQFNFFEWHKLHGNSRETK